MNLDLRPFVGSRPITTQAIPLRDRLASAIDYQGERPCWEWRAALTTEGYGRIMVDGKRQLVHRVVYELLVGPIPEGMELDHLCRNRACCNPAHLEPVTHRENLLRGETVNALHAAKTHCIHGHEFTTENTYRRAATPNNRCCRECNRIRCRTRGGIR